MDLQTLATVHTLISLVALVAGTVVMASSDVRDAYLRGRAA